jgi:hypothetical protein
VNVIECLTDSHIDEGSKMKIAIAILLSVFVLLAIVLNMLGNYHTIMKLLPPSATEVAVSSDGVFSCHPDSYYAMRAKLDEEDFLKIVAKLGLSEDEMQFDVIGFGLPSGQLGSVYRERELLFYRLKTDTRSLRVIAAYQDGYMYFQDSFGH